MMPAVDALEEPVLLELRLGLEDQLALQMRCLDQPAMRAGRLRREALIVLSSPLWLAFGLELGVLIAWFADAHHPSLLAAMTGVFVAMPGFFLVSSLILASLVTIFLLLRRRLVRVQMRGLIRRVLKVRPDVDAADPQLGFPGWFIIGPDGVESRSASGVTVLNWSVLKTWEETNGRLFVLGEAMTGVGLLVATLPPERLDRLRALLSRRLGPPQTVKRRPR